MHVSPGPYVTLLRFWMLRLRGVRIEKPSLILAGTRIRAVPSAGRVGSIQVGPRATLSTGVVIESWGGNVTIAENVFFGPYCVIYGHGGVDIGSDTLISMHCRILSSNHSVPEMGTAIRTQPDLLLPTRIGKDVWLGAGVTVLGGVVIGDGCVIGAGSVVTKSLPPGAIAHGVPCTVKGYRTGAPSA